MKQAPSKTRYDAEKTVMVSVKLNRNTDADILERLEREASRQGFIKDAIRAYIKNGGK